MARVKPGVKKLRTITIRASLITATVSLVVLVIVGTMAGTIFLAKGQVRLVSRSLVTNATEHVAAELKSFFQPVPVALVLIDRLAKQDGFDAGDTTSLNKLFMPIVSSLPMVGSANTGDENGNSYVLLSAGQHWMTRETRPNDWGARVRCRQWEDETTVIQEWWEDQESDVRQQPWYKMVVEKGAAKGEKLRGKDKVQLPSAGLPGDGNKNSTTQEKPKVSPPGEAREADRPPRQAHIADGIGSGQAAGGNSLDSSAERRQMSWTEPYYLGETKVPAITGARMVFPAKGDRFVAALDLLLTDISKFTQRLKPSENGIVWVMTTDSKMIGLPRQALIQMHQTDQADILKRIDDLNLMSIKDATGIWRSRKELGHDMSVPQREVIGDKACWISMSPFDLTDGLSLHIVVMLPESDFFDQTTQQQFIFVIAVLAMAFALGISTYLSGRFSQPLRSLVAQSERLQRLDLVEREPVVTRLHEVKQLTDSHDNMRKALGSFAHYLPTELVRELLKRGEAASIGVKERNLTVMFSDIKGFTGIAEQLEPAQLTEQIAEHFEAGLDALQTGGATIDKLMGDAIMAFWGAPKVDRDHSRNAVISVLEYGKKLEVVNRLWENKGWPRFETRVGLASGDVLVGNIGTYSRFDYTVVGDTVNLASRLEGINKLYGTQVLVSGQTKLSAGSGFAWRMVDKVSLKGKTIPVQVFELLGYEGEVDWAKLRFAAQYEKALGLFWDRQFKETVGELSGLGAQAANDLSVSRLSKLCLQFEKHKPAEDWDGSTNAAL